MSKWIWTVIACVAVAAVAFFRGVLVGRMTGSSAGGGRDGRGAGAFGQNGAQGQSRGGIASGTVLKKDASSITIKLRDGGSRIVLLSPSTTYVKSEQVKSPEISVGTTVTAMGDAASDGTVTARVVQLGDAGLGGMRGLFGGPGGAARQGGQGGAQGEGPGQQQGDPGGQQGMPGPPPGP